MNSLPMEQTWMVLVDLLTDLKKRGVEISQAVTEDIRMAKTLINFYKVDPTDPERNKEVKRINEFMSSVQIALMDFAEKQGDDYRELWMEKLKKVSRGEQLYKLGEKKSKFVVGAPSGFSMVRITFKKPISEDRLQEIEEYHNVIMEFENDEIVVIYGDDEHIKDSLKEISPFFKEQMD
jgi:hypothetical protein